MAKVEPSGVSAPHSAVLMFGPTDRPAVPPSPDKPTCVPVVSFEAVHVGGQSPSYTSNAVLSTSSGDRGTTH